MAYKNISFTVWDIGGQDKIRNLWRVYFQGSGGIIFVIGSSDRERMSEVKTELWRLLEEDELENVHLLIFANKQDVENAMNTTEIREQLGLNDLKKRSWFVLSYNFALDTYHPLASRRGRKDASFSFTTSGRVRPNSMRRVEEGWLHKPDSTPRSTPQ